MYPNKQINAIACEDLARCSETLDIVLFTSKTISGRLQRLITGGEYGIIFIRSCRRYS